MTDWRKEIAESNPIFGSEMDGSPCCIFCACLSDNPGTTPESHDPTCLWRRAVEAALPENLVDVETVNAVEALVKNNG